MRAATVRAIGGSCLAWGASRSVAYDLSGLHLPSAHGRWCMLAHMGHPAQHSPQAQAVTTTSGHGLDDADLPHTTARTTGPVPDQVCAQRWLQQPRARQRQSWARRRRPAHGTLPPGASSPGACSPVQRPRSRASRLAAACQQRPRSWASTLPWPAAQPCRRRRRSASPWASRLPRCALSGSMQAAHESCLAAGAA